MDEKWFWQALLNTQCEIIAAIEGGGGIADNVNVLSVIPGVGATNLGKAEDAPAASGDVGVAQLIKRTDTPAAQTDTDGDYTVPVANSFGAQQVNIDSGFQRAAATGLLKLEDVASASGDAGVAILLKRTDTAAAQTDTTGDYTLPVANSFGAQQINIDSTFQATAATGLLKLEDAAHASGDAGVAAWGVANTALAAFGANGDYTPHATSTKGVGLHTIVYDSDIAITATPIKLEDAAFSNGDPMLMAGAVNNRSYGSYNSTNGDATPISVGDRGVVLTTLMYDSSMGGGSCAIVPEDQAISNGQATVLNGFQRQDTPTVDTDTSGDCALAKSNSVGALYTEQANQVAVPALGTLGFAGVTTTYATLLTNSAKGLILSVDNKLDKDVYISTNGSTDHYFVAAGGSKIIDFGSNGRWVASNISVKSIGANATSGNIYATVVS
jgi:hypothetical protein